MTMAVQDQCVSDVCTTHVGATVQVPPPYQRDEVGDAPHAQTAWAVAP